MNPMAVQPKRDPTGRIFVAKVMRKSKPMEQFFHISNLKSVASDNCNRVKSRDVHLAYTDIFDRYFSANF
jgi:hypothetical protein